MKEKMKKYVEMRLDHAKRLCVTKEAVNSEMHLSLGAVQFVIYCSDKNEYKEISEWWSTKRKEFDKILESKVS